MIGGPRKRSHSSAVLAGAASLAFVSVVFAADIRSLVGRDQELRASETRSYEISVASGQFVEVELEQKGGGSGVDLSLLAPDQTHLATSRIPNDTTGPQAIALIVPSDGVYIVRTANSEKSGEPARFVFRTVVIRNPSADDRARAAAETAYAHAQELQSKPVAESRRQSIGEYLKALAYFEGAKDEYRVGMICNAVGLVYARTGDMRTALGYFGRAQSIFQFIKDRARESDSVNNAAGALDVLGELDKAHDMYEKALEMSRASGDRRGEAVRLNNIGKILQDQAKYQEAIDYYQRALLVFQSLTDNRRIANVLANLSSAYKNLSQIEVARDYLVRAVELERQNKFQDSITALHLASLGAIEDSLNHSRAAVTWFEQSLILYRSIGDKRGEAMALSSYGLAAAHTGDLSRAKDLLTQAAAQSQSAGDRLSEALSLSRLATLSITVGQFDAALGEAQRALDGFLAVGDSSGVATALAALARATRAQGKLLEAREFALQALNSDEKVRTNAGADQTRASFFASRQDDYQFTIDLLMDLDATDSGHGWAAEALATSERARARSLVDMLTESQAQIKEGVEPALLTRRQSVSDSLNAKGARLLASSPSSMQAETLRREIRALELEEQEIQAAIRRTSPHYAELIQPHPLTTSEIQRDVLDSDSVLLEFSLGVSRSVLWGVSKDSIQAWVLPGRQTIEQQVAEVCALLVARGSGSRMETPPEARRRIGEADRKLAAAAQALSLILLAPARAMITDKRIVIVPDGALQRLPFSMLPEPGSAEPLVAGHEIVVLPSASALQVLREQVAGRTAAPRRFAVFADPVFDRSDPRAARTPGPAVAAVRRENSRILEHGSDSAGEGTAARPGAALNIPRLPFTAEEANQILRIAADPTDLKAVGFDASRALATSGILNRYRYVHFATHGYLDTERPSLSALVLSQLDEKRNAKDGFLRVNDIYNMKLSADLVVLSACQTGLGKEVQGEGLMGLTRAFLYAGAPRLIVSLWNVNDRATAELMVSLYRGMLRDGKRPSAALRAAQMAMRSQKRWESPYYWAAFVQQGDWN